MIRCKWMFPSTLFLFLQHVLTDSDFLSHIDNTKM